MSSKHITDPPPFNADVRLSASISEIENMMKITGCLKGDHLPREVETVIAQQFGHYIRLGELLCLNVISDLREHIARLEVKVEMMSIDLKLLTSENALLRDEVRLLRGS